MVNGTSAVDLHGTAARAEQRYKQKEAGERSFRNVYQNVTESMDDIFEEAASTYDISVDLLKAVAKAESNFNPDAVSHAGAMGVMQLMPGTASSLGVTDPFDARQNIMGGAKYLKNNLERYGGNISLALAAYNAGPGSVEKYGGVPPYKETQNYVKKVASYMDGSPLTAGTMVSSTLGMGGISGSGSNLYGSSALSGLYGTSVLGGLYGSYMPGSASASVFGNLMGASSSIGSLGDLSSSENTYGTSELAGLGGMFGSSALTGMGSMYGLSSIYGSSTNFMSLLFGAALQDQDGDGEADSVDKDALYNLVEMMKLQMLMNVNGQAGMITI